MNDKEFLASLNDGNNESLIQCLVRMFKKSRLARPLPKNPRFENETEHVIFERGISSNP